MTNQHSRHQLRAAFLPVFLFLSIFLFALLLLLILLLLSLPYISMKKKIRNSFYFFSDSSIGYAVFHHVREKSRPKVLISISPRSDLIICDIGSDNTNLFHSCSLSSMVSLSIICLSLFCLFSYIIAAANNRLCAHALRMPFSSSFSDLIN